MILDTYICFGSPPDRTNRMGVMCVKIHKRHTYTWFGCLVKRPLRAPLLGCLSSDNETIKLCICVSFRYLHAYATPIPIFYYPLPTTHYPLPTTHYTLPTTHYPLPTTHPRILHGVLYSNRWLCCRSSC